jgi:hypothetical protein
MDKSTPRPDWITDEMIAEQDHRLAEQISRLGEAVGRSVVVRDALVEALREAAAMVDEYSCRTPVGHIASECEAVVRRARAALALAEGK